MDEDKTKEKIKTQCSKKHICKEDWYECSFSDVISPGICRYWLGWNHKCSNKDAWPETIKNAKKTK